MDEIILQNKNGKILASSCEVTEKFGKQHKDVLENIKNSTTKFFKETTYENKGKKYLMYEIDRDGFFLLAMGFTSKKVLEQKLKYINAFNTMKERLKASNYLSEEKKLKLQLSSKNPLEVASAHIKLVELATASLIAKNKSLKPKTEYHDDVLNKQRFITTTVITRDLGLKNTTKLNQILNINHIIFKNKSGTWYPYADYE